MCESLLLFLVYAFLEFFFYECCGKLPTWRPFDTQNGRMKCCGKKVYDPQMATCNANEKLIENWWDCNNRKVKRNEENNLPPFYRTLQKFMKRQTLKVINFFCEFCTCCWYAWLDFRADDDSRSRALYLSYFCNLLCWFFLYKMSWICYQTARN